MKLKHIAMLAVAVLLTLPACKPTEKNYRAAYDAAKAKREAANAETMIPATGLLSDDGPEMRVLDGDTIFVSRDRISPSQNVSLPGAFVVAVGVYKMDTNAKAQAAKLQSEGYDAHAVKTTGDRWYCVAGSCETLDAARIFAKEFRSRHRGYPYIGLPGAPVVLRR